MAVYRYEGNKDPLDQTELIVLDGSLESGGRRVSLGGEVELSDDEVENLRQFHNLRKVDEGSSSDDKDGDSEVENDSDSGSGLGRRGR